MIPAKIEAHLRECHGGYEHHPHRCALSAQELAEVEHVTGHQVAKPVVVRIDGDPAIVVVSAAEHVRLGTLEEATGRTVELVPEWEFVDWFPACELGAEPPLAIFGMPIIADSALTQETRLVMPAGTHEDAVVVDTRRWLECERVHRVPGLGGPLH
jgi:Ala-tRNA(Pro) deacylase